MTLSVKPIDQEDYVWNKNYKGSLAQTRKTHITETELVGIRLQKQSPPELPRWGQGVL